MSANLNATAPFGAAVTPGYSHTALLVGRVLIALLFVVFGYMKLTNFGGTVGYFTKWGFPLPQVVAVIAIVAEFGGGILLLVGWKTRPVAWILAVYVVIAAAVAHRYWTYDPAQAFAQTSFFYKNLAITGGLLYVAVMGAGKYSVDKR
ncbi:MAG TPA: DoxX family protein [Burkholderiales bacterium]|jgi:Predicted membrane protein